MTGVQQLGYLVFQVSDPAAWETFATEVLGMGVSRRLQDGGLALRMDRHRQRLVIEAGPADDLAAVGWQADDEAALREVAERLRGAGVSVVEGSEEQAAARQVRRLYRFQDPAGIPSEIFCGPALAPEPFESQVVRSGFVADELGLGHVVLGAADQAQSLAFYTGLLGFRLSDRIVADVYGYHADLVFLHAGNSRHHSLALAEHQLQRLHHFLVEAREVDEVGRAFDRSLRAGVKIFLSIGRHPNDRMFSFYAKTPSGFQFEFGWGGRHIDDATWVPTTYDYISEWGHHPISMLAAGGIPAETARRGRP